MLSLNAILAFRKEQDTVQIRNSDHGKDEFLFIGHSPSSRILKFCSALQTDMPSNTPHWMQTGNNILIFSNGEHKADIMT